MESLEKTHKICNDADDLRRRLKNNSDFSINPVDLNLPVIPPYIGKGIIKLIILGQDPTIKNKDTRANITCTLNLDKKNSLKRYISEDICIRLGLSIENVYATNIFKYFYTIPPAETMDILREHLEPNLLLLQDELSEFESIPVITLGEPVLQLLTNKNSKVRNYWDYNIKSRSSNGRYAYSKAIDNKLNRDFFPLPHQPSIRKIFYRNTFIEYMKYMKTKFVS